MSIFKTLIMCFLATIVYSVDVHAKAKAKIEVGFVDFEPFFYNDNGKVVGSIVEKFELISAEAGYEPSFHVYPMKRLADFTKNGLLDMTILLKVVFDDEDVVASNEMLCEIELRNYTIGNKELILKKEDLSGKRIGIFRGFTYGGWIDYIKDPQNNVDYYEVSTHEQLLRMLELGRVDYALDYRNPSEVALKNIKIKNLKHAKITCLPVYMLVSKKAANGVTSKIVADYNLAYAKLLDSGKMRVVD